MNREEKTKSEPKKREWTPPKVEHRAGIDRTQGGFVVSGVVENAGYSPS